MQSLNEVTDYIERKVRSSPHIITNEEDQYHYHYWPHVVKHVTLDGLWLEFGVFRGRSIQRISSLIPHKIYGFDSFQGLHEAWDTNNPKGVYDSGGVIPVGAIIGDNHSMFDSSPTKVYEPWNSNVVLVKGFFDQSLPRFLAEQCNPTQSVAFLHIDSDLYSSCKTVLDLLKCRIIPNTVICFDELLDYPDFKQHEIKAFAEFLIDTGYDFEALIYHGAGAAYSQACIRIISP